MAVHEYAQLYGFITQLRGEGDVVVVHRTVHMVDEPSNASFLDKTAPTR